MKIITKRAGKFSDGRPIVWLALKDKEGLYHHIWYDKTSDNFWFVGYVAFGGTGCERIIRELIAAGHTRGK